MQQALTLLIRNRERVIFNGEVKAVSSLNDKGPFDILPRHANMISIVKKIIVIHKKDRRAEEIEIRQGILTVGNNTADIYLDVESPIGF